MASKARTMINNLLDDNSFVEFGEAVTARSTDFNDLEPKEASDGVITGHGLINDSLVFVYAQDASVLGGTIGEMHAKKIAKLYDMATKVGAPVVGLIDSNGVRLYEAMDSIEKALEQIRTAFEKQHDALFEEDALDMTTDVAVLETLLKQDALDK